MLPWMPVSRCELRLEQAVELAGFGEVGRSDVEAIIETLAGLLREQKLVNESRYSLNGR